MTNFNHQFISSHTWQVQADTCAHIKLQNITFFTPIGLTFLAGYIEKQMDVSETGTIQFNPDVINYLERMEFLGYLESRYADRFQIIQSRPAIHRIHWI